MEVTCLKEQRLAYLSDSGVGRLGRLAEGIWSTPLLQARAHVFVLRPPLSPAVPKGLITAINVVEKVA